MLPSATPASTLITHGPFYSAYKKSKTEFSAETFRCAEETVRELLAAATTSERPGMLLGKVQSGKTRTFISIMALAFDNGYDVVVVLSKNSKALIEQTTKRLHSEFNEFVEDGEMEVYDIMAAPTTFTEFELNSKLVFAAKKQKDNLRRLIDLYTESCPAMADKRTLIIDDEADNASIGYSKKDELVTAKTIAAQISEFRSACKRSSFLQVTATPYSLYLQPTDIEVANVTAFKPTRPAFTELVPVPPEYVGGETYFGDSAWSSEATLESLIHHSVDHREFDRLKRPDGRSFTLEEVLTTEAIQGIRQALVNFLVGGAILRINGIAAGLKEKKLRYSFLLHSEAGITAHDWQETLTKEILAQLHQSAVVNAPVFRQLVEVAYADLARSVKLANRPVPVLSDVLVAVALALASQITVAKVNSDDDVAALLDNTGQLKLRSPFSIFIGGQVLDRGVTMANLIGFYYGRRPNKYQQDTVLQHSRMYGYRRSDLAVTRFYTSPAIRHAMSQMEEFDASLRAAINAGGDRAVQFIRKAADGKIVPCNPNKILVATSQTLKPHKRILPIGFQSGYRTGANGIGKKIDEIDNRVRALCGFNTDEPKLIPLETILDLLNQIEPTLVFEDEDAPPFDWDSARAALCHLAQQHPDPKQRGQVWLWAAKGRDSARKPTSENSHVVYIETPDSEKTEGRIAKKFAVNHPILFLLRQDGQAAKGWRDTAFYWPVVRAQANTPTAIYTAETIS